MKRSRWIILVAILAGAAGLTYWYFVSRPTSRKPPSAQASPIAAAVIASSLPVERTFRRQVPWMGVVESQASVQLKSLQDARLESVEAADQSFVREGAVVMQLGGTQVETQRARLKASVEAANAQLELARQTVQRLQEDLAQQLATRDQLAMAQQAQIKLQQQLRDARLTLQSFEKQVRIAAPMAGVFTNRRVSPGQAVSTGEVLGEIIDPNHLRIVASLFPPAGVTLVGKEATARLAENESLAGTVGQILPQAGSTGAVVVWIEGPQVNERLRAGQTASGDVTVSVKSAPAVPQSAVVYDANETPYVFIHEEGRFERHGVGLGMTQDGWIEVVSGLEPGRYVVTKGAYELFHSRFSEQFKVED